MSPHWPLDALFGVCRAVGGGQMTGGPGAPDPSLGALHVVAINRPHPRWAWGWFANAASVSLVDGGCQRFCAAFGDRGVARLPELPAAAAGNLRLVGDFDSVDRRVLGKLKDCGARVFHSDDVMNTDLDKALLRWEEAALAAAAPPAASKDSSASKPPSPAAPFSCTLLVLGVFGGRYDHQISNVNSLATFARKHPEVRVIGVGEGNLVCFAMGGATHSFGVRTPAVLDHCGYWPVLREAESVTSTGFCWDVENTRFAHGEFISTCNLLQEDFATRPEVVTVSGGENDMIVYFEIVSDETAEIVSKSSETRVASSEAKV